MVNLEPFDEVGVLLHVNLVPWATASCDTESRSTITTQTYEIICLDMRHTCSVQTSRLREGFLTPSSGAFSAPLSLAPAILMMTTESDSATIVPAAAVSLLDISHQWRGQVSHAPHVR